MFTVKEITGFTPLEIKQMSLSARIELKHELEKNNQHTAFILVDAVVQSNQTIMDNLCALHTLHHELGGMLVPMQEYRKMLSLLLQKK